MARIKFGWHKTFTGQLPLRSNCDPLDPRQALLPAFTGFMVRGAPLFLPLEFFEELSEHLVEYLGIPVEVTGRGTGRQRRLMKPLGDGEDWQPRRKYQPPTTVLNKGAASGKWVTPDEPDPEPETVRDALDRMAYPDQVAVKDAVFDKLGITEEPGPPSFVLVKDFRRYLGLSHAQAKTMLDGWGVPNATPGTRLEKGLCARIIAHIKRLQAGQSA